MAVELIKPEEITLQDDDGNSHTYTLSNFDAVQGREIIMKYPLSALPKLGDYEVSQATMLKLMSYVAVPQADDRQLRLTTLALVNNHVQSWEMLGKLEMAMLEKNCRFFRDGRSFDFLERAAQMFMEKISEILTSSSAVSSPPSVPPTTNSEPSTT